MVGRWHRIVYICICIAGLQEEIYRRKWRDNDVYMCMLLWRQARTIGRNSAIEKKKSQLGSVCSSIYMYVY